jgi:glycosyltransferase involved in cell wall biosynthesis
MIIQVGGFPPPYGGVSIYIKRLKEYLDSLGMSNYVWDISHVKKNENHVISMRFLLIPFFLLIRKDISIIHYNVSGFLGKQYIGFFNRLFFKNRKKVLSIHGKVQGLFLHHQKSMINILNTFDAIICVKKNDKEYLIKKGINVDIYEIPGFIPPIIKNHEIKEISQRVWSFIDKHDPIISANASRISFYNNRDLYGIDMCIDLCSKIKSNYPNIGFVIFLPEIGDLTYYKKIRKMIDDKGIRDNVLIYAKPCQFYPILLKSDIFVRPTNTDGDAVSVREALFFKVPTIASDVVPRPNGTILFSTRDIDDFNSKVLKALANYEMIKKKVEQLNFESSHEKIIDIYNQLCSNN